MNITAYYNRQRCRIETRKIYTYYVIFLLSFPVLFLCISYFSLRNYTTLESATKRRTKTSSKLNNVSIHNPSTRSHPQTPGYSIWPCLK